MNRTLLDSSALLAVLNEETGADKVLAVLVEANGQASISAVNLSEVQAVLVHRGMPDEVAWDLLSSFDLDVIAFEAVHARLAGTLIAETRKLGLSLGDRACLATALQEDCPVMTADRAWKKLKLNVSVNLIRT